MENRDCEFSYYTCEEYNLCCGIHDPSIPVLTLFIFFIISYSFHTGDMGHQTEDGFVKITGRIKEQYKLENGKYVVPSPIEEAISMSRYIRQVVVCGSNRPYNVCLIVPEWDVIRSALKLDPSTDEDTLANDLRVRRLIDSQLDIHLASLKKYERPLAWAFVAPFTAVNNMLTPKMSIRRHMVVRAYEDVIAKLYQKEETDESHKDIEDQAKRMKYTTPAAM
jgi:long-chain acyl-CoA synthetase